MSSPPSDKSATLRRVSQLVWHESRRAEQTPPVGDWRVWYLRGGRGSGKTRAGAETFADWIMGHPPGDWAIVAPTFSDCRSVCVEGESGLLNALGRVGGLVENWNRSEGVLHTTHGARVYLDGADDGALRIQGKNLRGAWCDEVGLWRDWSRAWNESLAFAVRLEPGRIIATGTPKMGHPLVGKLLADPLVASTLMRTSDNAENLHPAALEALLAEYEGTTLGRQELDAEYIEALEGEILKRADWRYYNPALSFYSRGTFGPEQAAELAKQAGFTQILHSWDTSLKDNAKSDFVSGQVWGIAGALRYLLRLVHRRLGLNATIEEMHALGEWALEMWPGLPHRILVEAAATGPDAIMELKKRLDGVISVRAQGPKEVRAMAASPALEGHNCYLPGYPAEDLSGYDPRTPAEVQAFVDECALFRADGKHAHDDQVDGFSQMVNWTRANAGGVATMSRPGGRAPVRGALRPVGGSLTERR